MDSCLIEAIKVGNLNEIKFIQAILKKYLGLINILEENNISQQLKSESLT